MTNLGAKDKSSDQILAEFQAFTLPKLRMKRLVKIQAIMKGYYTRKFRIPKLRIQRIINLKISDDLINTFIEDKFIPDIVLEVVTSNKYNEDLQLYSEEHRVHLRYISDIFDRTIRKMCQQVVKE